MLAPKLIQKWMPCPRGHCTAFRTSDSVHPVLVPVPVPCMQPQVSTPFTYDRLLLEPQPQLPNAVKHLLVDRTQRASDLIAENLNLPLSYVCDLFTFGAVYSSSLPPPPPPNLPHSVASQYRDFVTTFQKTKSSSTPGTNLEGGRKKKTLQQMQSIERVSSPETVLPAGSYVRVHVHPRRFPRCYSTDWKQRVIAETDNFVVVDKPSGVPVGGTVDNQIECTAACTGRALGMPSALRITHQLDQCTQGCVVLAKDKRFASAFNTLLKDRKVHKLYKVLSSGSVPQKGIHTHYMLPSRYPPRIATALELPDSQKCQLRVLQVESIPPLPARCLVDVDVDRGMWPEEDASLYESTVELITGRTHQVRVQFALMGSPLVGDTMYGVPGAAQAMEGFAEVGLQMDVTSQGEDDSSRHEGKRDEANDAGDTEEERSLVQRAKAFFGPGPNGAIGLQAFQIQWEDKTFQAGPPWWRHGT